MRRILIASVALAAMACSSDKSTGTGDNIAGTYTLTKAAGKALPSTVFDDGTTQLIVLSGTITLTEAKGWSANLNVRTVESGDPLDESLPATGTWVRSGSTITFTDASDNSTFTATVSGKTITANVDAGLPSGLLALQFTK